LAQVIKTIRTISGDYSTLTLFQADLNNTTYPDANTDVVGEMYNDSDFIENVNFSSAGSNIDSIIVRPATGEGHDGTEGTGVVLKTTGTADNGLRLAIPNFTFTQIELDGNSATIKNQVLTDSGTATNLVFSRCLLHNMTPIILVHQTIKLDDSEDVVVMDNILYDIGGATFSFGIIASESVSNNQYIINNTIHDFTSGSTGQAINTVDESQKNVRNNLITDLKTSAVGFLQTAPSNAVYDHNITSDSTASGPGRTARYTTGT